MNLFATIAIAFAALGRNKLRSALTMLGVVIGVLAVIVTVALGEGAKAQQDAMLAAMGTNLLIVLPGSTQAGGQRGGFGSGSTLTWDDLRAIQNELSSVKAVSPGLRSTQSILAETGNWTTQVWGVSPEYFDIRNWQMAGGERFTQGDLDAGNKVVVLGATVVEKLFGEDADPVGQSIRIRNIPFTIIGVTVKKGQAPNGMDQDDQVLVPASTFATKLQGGMRNYLAGMMYVSANDPPGTAKAQRDITGLLRDRHKLAIGAEDDFQIRNLAETASTAAENARTSSLLILVIGAVSLLVGGIGIMNIMLVSVTERTREIGTRMAVGAQPGDILAQFIVESLVLSTLGGVFGLVFGAGLVWYIASTLGWPMLIRVDSVAIAIGFSALIGLVFGLYPAWKASQLDPIDALRYE